jgi:hypothetical protein
VEVAAKLQLKPGMALALLGAPPGLALPLPPDGSVADDPGAADAVLAFARTRGELEAVTPALQESARAQRLTWIAYPKAGQLETDLNRDGVRAALQPAGLNTVRQVALDDTWSALRLR